jgi:hypothetical protein
MNSVNRSSLETDTWEEINRRYKRNKRGKYKEKRKLLTEINKERKKQSHYRPG